jgi:hypothetical protein
MPARFFSDPPRQEVASPAITRLLFVFFGVAALLGMITGGIWVAWNLFRPYVLGR